MKTLFNEVILCYPKKLVIRKEFFYSVHTADLEINNNKLKYTGIL